MMLQRSAIALILGLILLPGCARMPADYSEVAATAAAPRRILISGHSLTDGPYPGYLTGIADHADQPARVDTRNMSGSSISMRIEGGLLTDIERGMAPGQHYDTLIITEQHTLLGNIVWNDSVRNLRRAHDRLISADPSGRTFLFASWLDVDDKDDPRRWLAIEAAAAPVWQCVASRINHSLSAEGRSDRITVIPSAAALAWLVGRATDETGVLGLSGATTRETLARLFLDDVHPTAAASYFVALVTEAYVYRRPPRSAGVPRDVPEALGRELQRLAWIFASRHGDGRALTLPECQDHVSRTFVPLYLDYQRDTRWRGNGALAAYFKWARHRIAWPMLFHRRDASNPFHFDPARDASYWQG